MSWISDKCSACYKSRSPEEWRKVCAAYGIFYVALAVVMAIHMAVLVATLPSTNSFSNGAFTLGEPRFTGLNKPSIYIGAPKGVCEAANLGACQVPFSVGINSNYEIREIVGGDVVITCTTDADVTFSNCVIPATDAAKVGPSVDLSASRSCTASGKTATITFQTGDKVPYGYVFDVNPGSTIGGALIGCSVTDPGIYGGEFSDGIITTAGNVEFQYF